MEKRRAGVTPLKKLTYDAKEESNWWGESDITLLTQKRIDLIYGQLEEYKKIAEEAENERVRVLRMKIEELLENKDKEEVESIAERLIMNCQEHQQTITQLRKRLNQKKEEKSQKEEEPPTESIKQYVEKIERLEERINNLLSKYPVDYTKTVKALTQENKELAGINEALGKRVREAIEAEKALRLENQRLEAEEEARKREIEKDSTEKEAQIEGAQNENKILKKKTEDLYLAIETLNSTVVDKTRELENQSINREKCSNMCHERIQQLENKEITRLEEVSFLVRKYIDTGKKNDSLLIELNEIKSNLKMIENRNKECESNQKVDQKRVQEDREKYLKEIEQLKVEIEKSRIEYLERKSSAQYHKRKSAQYEAELQASKKIVGYLEDQTKQLQERLEEIKRQKATGHTQTDIELYQRMIRCNVCCTNIKNIALKKCMHLMCRSCIDTRMMTRQKTCPLCGTVFTPSDIASVYL